VRWIGPTDGEYDERRALFNAMIDKRPRLIAACETAADVRSALEHAEADNLMAWPAASAPEVARAYRDWADGAPEELGSGLVMLSGPPEDFMPAHLQNEPNRRHGDRLDR
jgi:hypothetical protein